MTGFDDWAARCDFAFIGIDRENHVGVFYVDGWLSAVPQAVRERCTPECYSRVMSYLLDELRPRTNAQVAPLCEYARYDAERGLFVYMRSLGGSAFVRVGMPGLPILASEIAVLSESTGCLVEIGGVTFAVAAEVPWGVL